MVVAAGREIADGEVVFVGMRLPLLGFLLAKETHAPRAVGLYENGVIRDLPASEFLVTMSDPPNVKGASVCTDMLDVMGLLQQGRVHLGFLGAAEVDRYGNLNSTQVRGNPGWIRLPGSGGACDIASLSQRFVVIVEHERQRLPARVSYCTSPGFGEGGDWRRRTGLPWGGPAAVITTRAILRFDGESGEAYLASVHPGSSVEEVRWQTGWELKVAPDVTQTPPPNQEELRIIRRYDPEGFWTS
ncbi:MAG: CoA-transferase [Acidobacteria bacterium]|nr:CoA-transferase [Acidobacteriota bacterium]